MQDSGHDVALKRKTVESIFNRATRIDEDNILVKKKKKKLTLATGASCEWCIKLG